MVLVPLLGFQKPAFEMVGPGFTFAPIKESTGYLTTPSRRLAPREEYQKKDLESESSGSNPMEGGE